MTDSFTRAALRYSSGLDCRKPRRGGDWPRCGAHCKFLPDNRAALALPNGRCKYDGGLSTGPKPRGQGARWRIEDNLIAPEA